MNRREWLKCMSALALSAAGAPLLAVFDAHAAAQKPAIGPRFFSPPQADVVAAVVDIIIPRTDTPGALDAGVPRFIAQMFRDVYSKAEQARYLGALAAFERAGGTPFLAAANGSPVAGAPRAPEGEFVRVTVGVVREDAASVADALASAARHLAAGGY